ncbi:hypothetical protein VKS41_006716 [Umbelopsis sp. WA50703]
MGHHHHHMNQWEQQHEQYHNTPSHQHKSHLSHELIAGAASFAAVRAYEEKCKREGRPNNHAFAKELLAGFAAAEADKLIETKGLDFLDRQKARHHAQQQVHQYYEHEYERR